MSKLLAGLKLSVGLTVLFMAGGAQATLITWTTDWTELAANSNLATGVTIHAFRPRRGGEHP